MLDVLVGVRGHDRGPEAIGAARHRGVHDGAHEHSAVEELGGITGQRASIRRAKRSIANFKLRAGAPIGCMVTLRGVRMWEFFDRLTSVAIPRIRDFRGLSPKSFDGRGNYTFGLKEQVVFPEIHYEKVEKIRGMDITLVTSAQTDDR